MESGHDAAPDAVRGPASAPDASAGLAPERVLDVLTQLEEQLGTVDPDARAIVGLRRTGESAVELVDVTLADNGVLRAPDEADGLVVVTTEEVAHDDVVVSLHQLMAVLRDGVEVGVYRGADGGQLRSWRTDVDPDDAAEGLRPRDIASNTARRAFGLPSVVDGPPPVTELLARAWLSTVASEALQRFDTPAGPRDVEVEELEEVAARPVLRGLADEGGIPTWEEVHAAAVAGDLELGPFSVDGEHAAWLDPHGLAQVLDRTLPPVEELLGTLRVAGNDEAMAWAIGWLLARDWYRPE